MTTALFTHPAFAGHRTPPGHPEQVARLAAVEDALAALPLARHAAPIGTDADVLRLHPARHLARLRAATPETGWAQADADTFLSPGSFEAAMRAVGGMAAAVDLVMSGGAANAFLAARPPGHHAERETAMGFCLFGTVALGAARALAVHGAARLAVLDFDVHHGNGTQDLLWNEPRALFASSHQMPLYPGTGAASETGAHGQIVNVPLSPGTGSAAMRAVWDNTILPRVETFAPDLILVSAGFDAHADDPLGGLDWTTEDFAWLTHRICDVADRVCGGRVVSALEGGYDLPALAASVAAHLGVLEERGRG